MDILTGGVNHSIFGNGGPDCINYISATQRFLETLVMIPVFVAAAGWALQHCTWPSATQKYHLNANIRRVVLAIYCIVFGIELGYKLSSRTVIYLLNPCHVLSAFQIYLLMVDAGDGPLWSLTFRLHVYSLAGGTLAMVFPVLNTRLISWHRTVYWVQHWMILLVPMYLMAAGGHYSMNVEATMNDYPMAVFSMAVLLLYHYVPLQAVGLWFSVNLNCTICPAVSDPFACRWWRIITTVHQSAFVPLHTYIYVWIADKLRPLVSLLVTDPNCETSSDDLKTTTGTSPLSSPPSRSHLHLPVRGAGLNNKNNNNNNNNSSTTNSLPSSPARKTHHRLILQGGIEIASVKPQPQSPSSATTTAVAGTGCSPKHHHRHPSSGSSNGFLSNGSSPLKCYEEDDIFDSPCNGWLTAPNTNGHCKFKAA